MGWKELETGRTLKEQPSRSRTNPTQCSVPYDNKVRLSAELVEAQAIGCQKYNDSDKFLHLQIISNLNGAFYTQI